MYKQIEADIKVAKELYPKVKRLIKKYTKFVDKYGDENKIEYNKLNEKILKITEKNINCYEFNLLEIWKDFIIPGKNMLKYGDSKAYMNSWMTRILHITSFHISFPEPKIINDLTREDIIYIIEKIQNSKYGISDIENKFLNNFSSSLQSYFKKLLKINFKNNEKYDLDILQINKNEKYMESYIEEIIENILKK